MLQTFIVLNGVAAYRALVGNKTTHGRVGDEFLNFIPCMALGNDLGEWPNAECAGGVLQRLGCVFGIGM